MAVMRGEQPKGVVGLLRLKRESTTREGEAKVGQQWGINGGMERDIPTLRDG